MYKPLNVFLELTYGCNRKCNICFKQVLDKDNPSFMSLKTSKVISEKLSLYKTFIKFSLRGEPLLNKNWLKIVKIIQEYNKLSPKILYTNGDLLTPKKANQYFDNGGNYIWLDCYGNSLNKRKELYSDFNVIEYYKDHFNIYENPSVEDNLIILVDDIRNNKRNERKIHNHAGNIDFKKAKQKPLKEPLNKPCLRPFRDLNIYYNGDVGLCCDDANLDGYVGNIYKKSIDELWKSYTLNKIRYDLLMNNRNNKPCNMCNYID